MGFFFLNRISRKERKWKRQKRCSSSSSSSSCLLVDRLPDDVVVRILSLLPTRECVRSSILGKRWRFLWARVPNLMFHSGDHESLSNFSDFFNRFAFVHKGRNINTFSIAYEVKNGDYKSKIERLITTAIACNVQVVDIHSGFELVLPPCLFTSKTLVDLTLDRVCVDDVPRDYMNGTTGVVFLPALKKLQLKRMVRYESEESLVNLISGCPALEELTILKENDYVFHLCISSPTLTRLHLEIDFDYGFDTCYRVKLDTPALKFLRLRDTLSRDFSVGMLASLTEADVFFNDQIFYSEDVLYHRSVLRFVGKLNNVSSLKLRTCLKRMEALDSAFSALTTTEFRNLTTLELVGDWSGDCRLVTYFLENSDNLQALIISRFSDHQKWMEPTRVPLCLKYHLGKVRFEDFQCSEAELNVVEYILKNAEVLKRMEILFFSNWWDPDLHKKSEVRQRISLFERASEACELAFD